MISYFQCHFYSPPHDWLGLEAALPPHPVLLRPPVFVSLYSLNSQVLGLRSPSLSTAPRVVEWCFASLVYSLFKCY